MKQQSPLVQAVRAATQKKFADDKAFDAFLQRAQERPTFILQRAGSHLFRHGDLSEVGSADVRAYMILKKLKALMIAQASFERSLQVTK